MSQTTLTPGGTATANVSLGDEASFDATSKTAKLEGPDGYLYDVSCKGQLLTGGTTNGKEQAFKTVETLQINDLLTPPCYLQYQSELDGREVTLGETEVDGLYVTRKIFSPAGGGYTRYLEYVRNPTSTVQYVYAGLFGDLASGATSSTIVNPTTTSNTYGIYGTTGTTATPAVGFLLGDANQGSATGYFYLYNTSGQYSYSYSTSIQPNSTVIFMHFVAQNNDSSQVQSTMLNLLTLSDPDALDGLSALEKSEIVTFTNADLGVGSPGDATYPPATAAVATSPKAAQKGAK